MTTLAIDIETYSSVSLADSGVYRYAEADDFEVLLFAYAYDDQPVEIVDLAQGEKLPHTVQEDICNPGILKTAYNANFERVCLSRHLLGGGKGYLPAEQWQCTMVHALTLGLPGSLEKVAEVLNTEQKDQTGKALIRYFSVPCKPTKANGRRTRNLPGHDPKKWEQFKAYCKQDVEVERDIRKKLNRYPITDQVQREWVLDQKINDAGVMVDQCLVENAIECDTEFYERCYQEAQALTGLENPNSVAQLKEWILENYDLTIESLNKATVAELIEKVNDPKLVRVLELRQKTSKTSTKKYQAIDRAELEDGRVRGLFQFYGAGRTGRWAGRLVQVQNLPRNSLPDLDLARQLVKEGEYDLIDMLYGDVSDTLSQLTRTALVPEPGSRFIVADFSAIEARIIAWLAEESWRMEVFSTHGKIYEASAAQMFHVPIEEITKGSILRQKGKVSELALGYGGGAGALKAMGALEMGLEEEELPGLVTAWRRANPNIVDFWWEVGDAAMDVVKKKTTVRLHHGIEISYESGGMFIRLPSGRRLCYVRPQIRPGKKIKRPTITYEGVGANRQWVRIDTYGPKLVENIVQGIARDCLAEAMLRLDRHGYKIVMHIHDEVVLEAPEGQGSLEEACAIMGEELPWAEGLSLPADGFETCYYMKD